MAPQPMADTCVFPILRVGNDIVLSFVLILEHCEHRYVIYEEPPVGYASVLDDIHRLLHRHMLMVNKIHGITKNT